MKTTCPECLNEFEFPNMAGGKSIPCPKCNKPIVLPESKAKEPASNPYSDKRRTVCPACQKTIKHDKDLIGTKINCPGCRAKLLLSDNGAIQATELDALEYQMDLQKTMIDQLESIRGNLSTITWIIVIWFILSIFGCGGYIVSSMNETNAY